jgi:hypothetical protein
MESINYSNIMEILDQRIKQEVEEELIKKTFFIRT